MECKDARSFTMGRTREQVEELYNTSHLTYVSPKQETAVVGYFLGQPLADIAKEENVSVSAIKERIRRAIRIMLRGKKMR